MIQHQQINKQLKRTTKIIAFGSFFILTSCSYLPTGQLKAMLPQKAKLVPVPVEKTNLPLTISASGIVNNDQIKAHVPQAKIAEIKVGQDVMIFRQNNLEKLEKGLEGQVQHISTESTVINNIPSVVVEIVPRETASDRLPANENVTIDFTVGELTNVLVVPNIAITEKNNTPGVLVGAPNQPPKFVPVTTGAKGGDRTEVKSGLNGTEHILIEASQLPPHLKKR